MPFAPLPPPPLSRCIAVTHWSGQDDVRVLNFKEVVDPCVARQLLAVQPQRNKLLCPVLKALTTESFDGGHWQGKTIKHKNALIEINDLMKPMPTVFFHPHNLCEFCMTCKLETRSTENSLYTTLTPLQGSEVSINR